MKQFPLEPSISATINGGGGDKVERWDSERPEIVFDDQPLECVDRATPFTPIVCRRRQIVSCLHICFHFLTHL